MHIPIATYGISQKKTPLTTSASAVMDLAVAKPKSTNRARDYRPPRSPAESRPFRPYQWRPSYGLRTLLKYGIARAPNRGSAARG